MQEVLHMNKQQLEAIDYNHIPSGLLKLHHDQIEQAVRRLGAVPYDLWLPETHVLPLIIQPSEQIKGIVYGRYKQETGQNTIIGRGALVATDRRVLLVDRKPLFMKSTEIMYRVVSAVNYSRVGFAGTITLHTRLGNINLRTFNQNCAHHFIEAIEANIMSSGEE